jgi:hypothetical protein
MLQRNQVYGKCSCGAFNALASNACTSCGTRLPWAGKNLNVTAGGSSSRGAQQTPAAQSPQARAARVQAQMKQNHALYWDNVFGTGLNDRSSASGRASAGTAAPGAAGGVSRGRVAAPQAAATLQAAPAGVAAYQYCPRCGTGLSRNTNFCPVCRKDTVSSMFQIDGQLVKLSLNISALVVGGFLLGVVWCSFLINYMAKTSTVTQVSMPPATVIQHKQPPDYRIKAASVLPR